MIGQRNIQCCNLFLFKLKTFSSRLLFFLAARKSLLQLPTTTFHHRMLQMHNLHIQGHLLCDSYSTISVPKRKMVFSQMSFAMKIVLCRLGISSNSNAGWHQVIFLFSIENLEAQLKRHPILSVYDVSRPPEVVLVFPSLISSLFKSQFSLLQVCYKWWTQKKTFQQNEHVFGLSLWCDETISYGIIPQIQWQVIEKKIHFTGNIFSF